MSQETYFISGYEISKTYHGNWMLEYETDQKEVSVAFKDVFLTQNDNLELNIVGPVSGEIYKSERGGPSVISTYYHGDGKTPDSTGNSTMKMRILEKVHKKIIDLVKDGIIEGEIE